MLKDGPIWRDKIAALENKALALKKLIAAPKNRAQIPKNRETLLKNEILIPKNGSTSGDDKLDSKGPDCFFFPDIFTRISFLIFCFWALAYFFRFILILNSENLRIYFWKFFFIFLIKCYYI